MKPEKLLAAFQSQVYLPEILKLKRLFEAENINFLFLKGLPLYLYFEKSYPQRVLADCDVLIDKKDKSTVEKIFNRLGYQLAQSAYSKFHRRLKDKLTEVTYFKVVNNCLVAFDVHFEVVFLMNQLGRLEVLYPQRLVDKMTQQFLRQKQQVKIKGGKFPILSPADLIIYLGLHFFHHNFIGMHRLKFLNKIVSYYRRELAGGLSAEIIDKVKHYQLQNFVYPGFALVNKYFDIPLSPKFMELIAPDDRVMKYAAKIVNAANIDKTENSLTAGISRFKNIFYLSPRPWHRKILVFFNPAVIYSIIWTLASKLNRQRQHFSL